MISDLSAALKDSQKYSLSQQNNHFFAGIDMN